MRIIIPILYYCALGSKLNKNSVGARLRNHTFKTVKMSLNAQGTFILKNE